MTLDQAAAPEDRRGPCPRQGNIEAASNLAYHQPAVVQNLPAVGIHVYLQAIARVERRPLERLRRSCLGGIIALVVGTPAAALFALVIAVG